MSSMVPNVAKHLQAGQPKTPILSGSCMSSSHFNPQHPSGRLSECLSTSVQFAATALRLLSPQLFCPGKYSLEEADSYPPPPPYYEVAFVLAVNWRGPTGQAGMGPRSLATILVCAISVELGIFLLASIPLGISK